MTPSDLEQITASYDENMAALKTETLSRGKFAWQMLWTGGRADAKGSTGPGPLVNPPTCEQNLADLCSPDSPQHNNRTLMYAFSNRDPSLRNHSLFTADLANFLLVRGDYAYLGHGWLGCSRDYAFPQELHKDYGVPVDKFCKETSAGSKTFVREYTMARWVFVFGSQQNNTLPFCLLSHFHRFIFHPQQRANGLQNLYRYYHDEVGFDKNGKSAAKYAPFLKRGWLGK